ncbi:hypothetical protein RSOLAG22IIIB_01222 [Rhizoctonia solani]|uniref:Uncharacterized protein n=1 Tax=Rhizoctonia solani TaxID=456999 RepID=A0A0K6G504_9AGAM|nr:hypothetical protein RSOLAG22IIIB_01222 [Rhizoctonia solani]
MNTSRPLPPLQDFGGNQEARNAYARLLLLEDQAMIPIRMLGQMLLQAPSLEGLSFIATRINELPTDQDIFRLASFHLDYFIGYLRYKQATSTQPFAEDLAFVQAISATLIETPRDHSNGKELALVRDNHRCVVTGLVHDTSFETVPGLRAEVIIRGAATGHTECSHILPKYLGRNIGDPQKRARSSYMWYILCMYGGIPIEALNGAGMNTLPNLLTLEDGLHSSFDELKIWFEATGVENQYRIGRRHQYYLNHLPQIVTLKTSSLDLPLPDPRYLALHAACARVIHLSGAAKHIERVLRDEKKMKVLSGDRSSTGLAGQLSHSGSVVVF